MHFYETNSFLTSSHSFFDSFDVLLSFLAEICNLERGLFGNFLFGLFQILPIIAVTFASGAFWEILFAIARKHTISEGFLVTCALIPLTLPPAIPLWQVAIATSFGIVIGKEIFGGVGMNIFNPALMARVFIFFTYPSNISGDKVWVAGPDGYSGATALSVPASQPGENAVSLLTEFAQFDFSWMNMFWGWIPGSIGESNKLLIILGAIFLSYITKLIYRCWFISWFFSRNTCWHTSW